VLKSNQHNWQCVINHLEFRGQKCSIKNLVLAGRCPEAVAPVFFGGRLLALNKKTGGIRPIAIDFTLRRLASKCANSFGTNKLTSYFYPHQLGIGTPGGREATAYTGGRCFLQFTAAYNLPSILFFGPYTVQSQEGAQQGDPSSAILFIHCCHLYSPNLTLVFWTTVRPFGWSRWRGGFWCCRDHMLGAEIGLSLNISKCELIAHSDMQLNESLLQSFSRVDIVVTTLLAAPLFHGPFPDSILNQRCYDLSRAVDRLSSIASQDALILLRASFSATKGLHMLRCLHQCLIHPSRSLMLWSNRQSSASPILISPAFSGSRPVFQLKTVG